MFKIKVKGPYGANLDEAIDRLLDGELDHISTVHDIFRETKGGGLFAANSARSVAFVVHFKDEPQSETVAEIIAKIRKIVGDKAHIEAID